MVATLTQLVPLNPATAFARWEALVVRWVRLSLVAYCKQRQESGELFQPGRSERAVGPEEVERLLAGRPGPDGLGELVDEARRARIEMHAALDDCARLLGGGFLWGDLAARLELSVEEVELLLLSWVAAFDPSLQRSLCFAWNDHQRRLPTAAFLWELARPERGSTGMDQLVDILHASSLLRHRVWELADPTPSIAFAQVRLHAHVIAVLGRAELTELGAVRLAAPATTTTTATAAVKIEPDDARPWLLIGPVGSGRRALAQARAQRRGQRLATCAVTALTDEGAARELVLGATRDALLLGAALHLEVDDELAAGPLRALLEQAARPGPVLISIATTTPTPSVSGAIHVVLLEPPAREQRAVTWRELVGESLRDGELADLAARYPLTDGQIRSTVEDARWRQRVGARGGMAELLHEAARRVLHRDLASLATPVVTRQGWDDLIVSDDTGEQIVDVIRYVRHRRQVFDGWNFGAKYDYGLSVTALLTGPPGTGKTMACALIAREIGLELYRVTLPQMVSKWIGETEKNIERLFAFAERQGMALLFDEADSLFAKRTSVESSSDRYANLETNFLLQRLENFAGVAFLTTNFPKGLDEGFERRIRFRIEFSDPDEALREQLWRSMLPAQAAVDDKVDYRALARGFDFTGAHIKEAVLCAAFLAAERRTKITHELLVEGGRAQYRKLGRLAREDLGQQRKGS